MAVTALVFGIISIIFCWIPVVNFASFLFGILAIVLGAVGKKNPAKKGLAIAGLVLGIISVAVAVIMIVACGGAIGAAGGLEALLYY